MRAIVVNELGGPEVMTLGVQPEPVAGPGQVVVQVAAAGVNFIDIYRRSGVYQQRLPYVPGSEGAGTVVAVGEGVAQFSAGDRVAWSEGPGSYAERVAVGAEHAVPVPGDIEGFVTSTGRFVDRDQAKAVGIASGQLGRMWRDGARKLLSSDINW